MSAVASGPPPSVWAFVDEYGNPNLATEKQNVSNHFIVAAVLVDASKLDAARAAAEQVRKRHFQTGEMKSSKLGNDLKRWRSVLTDCAALPFHIYALDIDKTLLEKDGGYQFKQSFYKNLCGQAYTHLLRTYPALHVRADQHGQSGFMKSFVAYVRKRAPGQGNLFQADTVDFVDGKTEVLVQLADLVAGALARRSDPSMRFPGSEELIDLLDGKLLTVSEWPYRKHRTVEVAGGSEVDRRIGDLSLTLAEEYIERHQKPLEQEHRARVAVLERLLIQRMLGGAEPLGTAALVEHLEGRGLGKVSETWVRRQVIAPLRDEGVLLTSSRDGYKLPDRRSDLELFVHHASSVCVPMLNRAARACAQVSMATLGDVDVMNDAASAEVRRMVKALEEGRRVEVEVVAAEEDEDDEGS